MSLPPRGQICASQLLLCFLCVSTFASPTLAKRKDDVVIMKNGDKMTGEIKQLYHGILYFKSGYMNSSVELDWNEVATLQSQDHYIIRLTSGTRLTSPIERSLEKGTGKDEFTVQAASHAMVLNPRQVIEIQQAEGSIWKQMNGDADFGFNYTSGSNPTTLSSSANITYQGNKNVVALSTSSQFSSQTNAPNTFRFTFDTQYQRFFARRWYGFGVFDYLKSDQQDLDWRTTYGAGFGRDMVRTDRSVFQLFGGMDYSHEQYFPSSGVNNSKNSLEGLVGARYATFRFKTLDLSWDGTMYPSITDSPRIRLVTNGNLKIELIKDLFWSFRVYENYDTHPPVNAPKNDFGVTTSLGYRF